MSKKTGCFILTMVLILGTVLSLAGCSSKKPQENIWENVFRPHEVKEKYVLSEETEVFKASHGYTLNTDQGYNGWYYLTERDLSAPMTYSSGGWEGRGATFASGIFTATEDTSSVLAYKPIKAGSATICGNVRNTRENQTASFSVWLGDRQIYPQEGTLTISEGDTVGYYFEVKEELTLDTVLYFVTSSGSAYCDPSVRYSYEEILYEVPEYNFWGDVHPFYHQGKMYMYNLEGHLEDVGNERYLWRLHTSTDLFHYTETDYEVFPFVQNHYNDSLYAYNSLFDKTKFPYGSRDMFLFYDKGAGQYVYFGLCYNRDMSSCWGYRYSLDKEGTSWSDMSSLRNFPYACDPECQQALYINDRWYIIVSIWGQSIHSVGRPSYLIGDKGKDFLENDWANKEFHYLDGEDLCAAQLVDVGSGHYLMYGWIPKTSYNNDEEIYFDGNRDHGLWGGNINMPREVYQNGDGTLSTRLNDEAVKRLNKGKLYSLPYAEGERVTLGTFSRTYTEFKVQTKGSKTISYEQESNGKTYTVTISESKKEDGSSAVYLTVGCLQDKQHRVASSIVIGDRMKESYKVQILSDGSIMEVFVDEKYSLSARTSMFKKEHTAALSSDGNAVFTDITVNKLADLNNIYD